VHRAYLLGSHIYSVDIWGQTVLRIAYRVRTVKYGLD